MDGNKLGRTNAMHMYNNGSNIHKETLITYDNEGEENTSSMSEKK